MKKLGIVLVFLVSLFANALAFAEITTGESQDINDFKVKISPMLVKTLHGTEVTGGVHRFQNLTELDSFLKEKENRGLSIKDSHKPKLNLIICDKNDVGYLGNLADMANMVTSSKLEGPLYELVETPIEIPERVVAKLNSVGIKNPVVVLVLSGKKAIPGGYWKKIIGQVVSIVLAL